MVNEIFIKGNVPSSKNGKRWTGKYLIHSKTTMKYIQNTMEQYMENKEVFSYLVNNLKPPYNISFTFYRGSRRKFDYINPAQTVQDLMVRYQWIEDDNCDYIIPHFKPYVYDKENPGVKIEIL